MTSISRETRAVWALDALRAYSDEKEGKRKGGRLYDDPETVLTDLIADCYHLAHRDGLDMERVLRLAQGHFEAEIEEEEGD